VTFITRHSMSSIKLVKLVTHNRHKPITLTMSVAGNDRHAANSHALSISVCNMWRQHFNRQFTHITHYIRASHLTVSSPNPPQCTPHSTHCPPSLVTRATMHRLWTINSHIFRLNRLQSDCWLNSLSLNLFKCRNIF